MAELIFYIGSMGSSKTAHALMTNFQFKERNKHVWLIKPAIDTREQIKYENGKPQKTLIRSRIGIEAWADIIAETDQISPPEQTDLIICDEAQFLTAKQVEELRLIVDSKHIPVYCYGLRTDFRSYLFEGAKRLLELATKIKELPTICECGNSANINAKFCNDLLVMSGDQVDIGGDEKYKAMCYKCWRKLRDE